jgi:hypothetical protein
MNRQHLMHLINELIYRGPGKSIRFFRVSNNLKSDIQYTTIDKETHANDNKVHTNDMTRIDVGDCWSRRNNLSVVSNKYSHQIDFDCDCDAWQLGLRDRLDCSSWLGTLPIQYSHLHWVGGLAWATGTVGTHSIGQFIRHIWLCLFLTIYFCSTTHASHVTGSNHSSCSLDFHSTTNTSHVISSIISLRTWFPQYNQHQSRDLLSYFSISTVQSCDLLLYFSSKLISAVQPTAVMWSGPCKVD